MKRVLDKGFIEVIDKLGNDLTVSNSARVSFGKRKTIYDNRDRRLVNFLAKNKHFSPFRHLMVTFHVKAPEFVMRLWYKHVVGCETTSSSSTKASSSSTYSWCSFSLDHCQQCCHWIHHHHLDHQLCECPFGS